MIPALVSVTAGLSSEFQRDTEEDGFQRKNIYDSAGMKPRTFSYIACDKHTDTQPEGGGESERSVEGGGGGVITRKGREANDLLTY